jgi:hypothetical protein
MPLAAIDDRPPPPVSTDSLEPAESEELGAYVREYGTVAVARSIGVARPVIERGVAGLRQRHASVITLRHWLAEQRTKRKARTG